MRAILLTAYCSELKDSRSFELNTPSAGEALARMGYTPAAYSGLLLANGVYLLNPKLPSAISGEGAGIVEAVGPGVTGVKRHASDIDEHPQ